ncbi:site-specific integrase [Stieleria sp. TO1_6]|uniref:tyrosine-type recombinase/integrase n=1 Tax=Stieleria tagensis TaxID=2956795 RepID=UPI00209AB2C6|nr:tyrosine-type recombinase/integrase [Stieleria tagensis]MCO8124584.1 site-specific integrase [Stieleria tagensis]
MGWTPEPRWEPSTKSWRVRYKNQTYRYPGGTGKSDREAEQAAKRQWKEKRRQIDNEAAESGERLEKFRGCIEEWRCVLNWLQNHGFGDDGSAKKAAAAVADLQERIQDPSSEPPDDAEWFLSKTPLDELDDDQLQETYCPIYDDALPESPEEQLRNGFAHIRSNDALWRDRLAAQKKNADAVDTNNTLAAQVDEFLKSKREEAKAGQISFGRAGTMRNHLKIVVDWAGGKKETGKIDGKWLADLRSMLLKRIQEEIYSTSYAKDVMTTTKQLIRWLVGTAGQLDHLPRNFDSKSLSIHTQIKQVETLTVDELSQLLGAARDRAKLYMLLGLNCGMTQIDISDLHPAEVDFENGTITRKRSKTRNVENVPMVKYKLWKETLQLLKQERSDSDDHVLLNRSGLTLVESSFNSKENTNKRDAVRLEIRRLSTAESITCTMKHFKKTAASALRNHQQYSGLERLFLGHAPDNMSDRHYTTAPDDLLAEATDWLYAKLKIKSTK